MNNIQIYENISYIILNPEDIRAYVIEIAKEEWGKEDFIIYNDDLYKSSWVLKQVDMGKIKLNKEKLATTIFQEDLRPRIQNQIELYQKNIAIPPLILRGEDFLIFDGYARYHFLKQLGVKTCLAYVGHIH
ncbi:MAG TPA: hypothetical protein VGO63_00130 [Candidatus Paceibacterota bacterium]|jgi:hypothetical protein|nr:hypothetical protein [Candidatus Paceibacterota bacterium]